MFRFVRSLMCSVGLHAWERNRPVAVLDGFPPPWLDYAAIRQVRRCRRCGKRQSWLPGYGGSEWGCWCPMEQRDQERTATS